MSTQTAQLATETSTPASANRYAWHRWAAPLLLAAIYTVFYLAKLPDPIKMVWDPDWGYQLAGATQIEHGRWPFLDFHAVYGPLAFLASALAQWLFGGRVIGEIALSFAGYLVSYLLLYGLTAKISGSRGIAFTIAFFALLVFPKLYKYYIVLTPLWVLWESWRYLEKPSPGRLLLLSLSIVVTGLYRPDTGLYAACAGLVCVCLAYQGKSGGLVKEIALFFGFLALCASPWLVFLVARHGLSGYFYQSIHDGSGLAKGLSLPWPRINFRYHTFATETFVAVFYNFFFTLVPFCAGALYASRKTMPSDQIKRLIATMVLAQLCLLESIHRTDYHHLNQALVPSLVLVGWVVSRLPAWFEAKSTGWRLAGAASVGAMACILTAAVVIEHRIGYQEHHAQSLAKTLSVYTGTPPQVVEYVLKEDPSDPYAQAALALHANWPDIHVFVMPYHDSLYYFSNRSFGKYMEILPGLDSDPRDQRDIITDLQRQNVKMVVVDPSFAVDDKPDRRIDHFARILLPYVMAHYRQVAYFPPLSVRVAPGFHLAYRPPISRPLLASRKRISGRG